MPICSEHVLPDHVGHHLDFVRNLTLSCKVYPSFFQRFVFRRLLPHVIHSFSAVQLRRVNSENMFPDDLPKLRLDAAVINGKPKFARAHKLADVVHEGSKLLVGQRRPRNSALGGRKLKLCRRFVDRR